MSMGTSNSPRQFSCSRVVAQHIMDSTVFLYTLIWLQVGGLLFFFLFGCFYFDFLVLEGFVVLCFYLLKRTSSRRVGRERGSGLGGGQEYDQNIFEFKIVLNYKL